MTSTSASDELKAQLRNRVEAELGWTMAELKIVDFIVDECLEFHEDNGCCSYDGWVYKMTDEEVKAEREARHKAQEIADERYAAERREMLHEACRDAGIDPKVLP